MMLLLCSVSRTNAFALVSSRRLSFSSSSCLSTLSKKSRVSVSSRPYRLTAAPLVHRPLFRSLLSATPPDPSWNNEATASNATTTTTLSSPTTTTTTTLDRSTAPLKTLLSSNLLESYQLAPPPPDYVSLTKGQRLVVIGDVHGDLSALHEFLELAQVYDKSTNEWIGGDTICVQCGDILDRGDEELFCFQLLAHLSRQAPTMGGGRVAILYGNHEALNAVGSFSYANEGGNYEYEEKIGQIMDESFDSPQWRLQFGVNEPARWAAMEPGGILSEVLLQHLKVALVVGRTVCVHAGLTMGHLRQYGGIGGMNRQARDWILQSSHDAPNTNNNNNNDGHFTSAEEILESADKRAQAASESMPECLGGGIGGESPVWMRDYSQPRDAPPRNPRAQKKIDRVLHALKAHRMVMGHTPQQQINAALCGKAWRVDVGASKGVMGGTPEVLEIIHGGDDGEDEVNILTRSGKVPASERQIVDLV